MSEQGENVEHRDVQTRLQPHNNHVVVDDMLMRGTLIYVVRGYKILSNSESHTKHVVVDDMIMRYTLCSERI